MYALYCPETPDKIQIDSSKDLKFVLKFIKSSLKEKAIGEIITGRNVLKLVHEDTKVAV